MVPVVDTCHPFIARHIPTPDDSLLVIRIASTIVVPGGPMTLALRRILTPRVWRLIERRKRTLDA